MGRRGPKPQPTAMKVARGNPGKRKLNEDEPELAAADLTQAPKGLPKRALEEWNRLGPQLVHLGVLTIGDMVVFEQYCRLVAEVEQLQQEIKKVGLGPAMQFGYQRQLDKSRALLKQFAAELGITPSSRSGVKAVKPKDTVDEKRRRFFGVVNGDQA